MALRRWLFAELVLLTLAATAVAQTPAPARGGQAPAPQTPPSQGQPPAPAQEQAQPPADKPAPPPPEAYTYQAEGRRDPFVSLLGTGAEPPLASRRGEGAAGISVAELSVRGVILSHGEYVAMVQGPENRTYLVRQGDRLLDGTIKSITAEGLVIVQEVNDPLSLVPTREVRKLLRSYADAKE